MRARQLMSWAQGFKSTNLPKHQLYYFPVEDIPNWQLQPGRDPIQWRINEVPSLLASRLLEVMRLWLYEMTTLNNLTNKQTSPPHVYICRSSPALNIILWENSVHSISNNEIATSASPQQVFSLLVMLYAIFLYYNILQSISWLKWRSVFTQIVILHPVSFG